MLDGDFLFPLLYAKRNLTYNFFMVNRFKLNFFVILIASVLLTATVTEPYTNLFGKKYNTSLDYSCCKRDQLYVHHYYTQQFLGLQLSYGYKVEPVGKPVSGGCNIQCIDDK
jgi:hypothetical protein